MAGYPTIKPAFTIKVEAAAPLSVGSANRKTHLNVVPMTGGTIIPEAGFSPAFEAEFVGTGNDYIHVDPDQGRMRLDAHAVAKTKDGALVYINYKGTANLTPEVKSIFAGEADNLTTPPGDLFAYFTFETGDDRYKELENGIFVAQGHFICEKGKPLIVEYRIGQVLHT